MFYIHNEGNLVSFLKTVITNRLTNELTQLTACVVAEVVGRMPIIPKAEFEHRFVNLCFLL